MAVPEEGALARYQKKLEELTFNSKPLIDDLTRAAGQLEPRGKRVVEIIRTRIMQVRPEVKLPCLYLLDSVMKNLKGTYLERVREVIVGVFCHCFEKLTDSDSRKALYKLRTTWPPFLSRLKLAAIDKHVHVLDPNWPVIVDKDSSGTIFVNPDFMGNQPAKPASIQDRRKVLLQQTKNQRQEREREMGLPVPQGTQDVAPERTTIPTSTTIGTASASSTTTTDSSEVKRNSQSVIEHQDILPPTKKIKVEPSNTDSGAPPIKESHLQLDDLPPELLPIHHENMLKKIERLIEAGNVTPDQRSTLVKQLEQLYELQKLKGTQSDSNHSDLCSQPNQVSNPMRTEPPSQIASHPPDPFPPDSLLHPSNPLPCPPNPFPQQPIVPLLSRPSGRLPPGPLLHNRPPDLFPPRPPEAGLTNRGHAVFRSCHKHYRSREHLPRDPGSTQGGGPRVPVADLFKNLVNAGMISDKGKQVLQVEVPGNHPLKVPNLTLTPATLKQHYSSVVTLLHVGEPCSSCGLRFSSHASDIYRSHLNWHYKINRQEKEGLSKSSRNWFMHPDDWMKYEEVHEDDVSGSLEVPKEESPVQVSSRTAEEREEASCSVKADDINEVCAACNEPFEQFWEEEEDAWHYRNALRDAGGKLYHTPCYRDIHS